MQKIEKVFLFTILGMIPPLIDFLTGWFITNQRLSDWKVWLAFVCGGVPGLIVVVGVVTALVVS